MDAAVSQVGADKHSGERTWVLVPTQLQVQVLALFRVETLHSAAILSVAAKVPFPVTLRFKPMLQRGIELVSLDASW